MKFIFAVVNDNWWICAFWKYGSLIQSLEMTGEIVSNLCLKLNHNNLLFQHYLSQLCTVQYTIFIFVAFVTRKTFAVIVLMDCSCSLVQ